MIYIIMACPEATLYEKLQQKTDKQIFVFFVNGTCNYMLRIRNITFFDAGSGYSSDGIDRYLSDKIKNPKCEKIYIINPRLYSSKMSGCKKIETIDNVNFLKYMKMYPEEIMASDNNNNNKYLRDKLVTEHKTAMFFSDTNLFIVGIDGYLPYDESYNKYLGTIDKFYYVIAKNPPREVHHSYHSYHAFSPPENMNVETIDNIDVFKFLKTYPELNAFYRSSDENIMTGMMSYYNFDRIAKITDNIHLGSDRYRSGCSESEDYFEKHQITDIIAVDDESNDYRRKHDLSEKMTIYKFPISESGAKDALPEESMKNLLLAVEKINDLVKQNKQIYVHCVAGINRSPAVVCMWLMKYGGLTFYEAYKKLAELRYIWTMHSLYDVLYNFAKENNKNDISPLKIVNHQTVQVNNDTCMMFAIYDTIHLESLCE